MSLSIAIAGRPNVGKSTLFNRLTKTRHAIVSDEPGVTRDRREGDAILATMKFKLIDTAGLEKAKAGTLQDRMREQSQIAIELADISLMVIDARTGILPDDNYFASQLRKSGAPVILVANKCEGKKGADALAESWRLGLGAPVPISAEHGEGLIDLYDAILALATDLGRHDELFEDDINSAAPIIFSDQPKSQDDEPEIEIWEEDIEPEAPVRIAVVGRPNMGKSTLVNTLLGEGRLLTGPEAGITRDSIMVPFAFKGKPYEIVDTAGIRRSARVTEKIERLMVNDAQRAIQFAKVCILMLDARQPPHKQDMTIARHIADEGRALVIAVNMWDDVKDKSASIKLINDRLQTSLAQLRGVPVVPISGLYGKGLDRLFQSVQMIKSIWQLRISTGRLNRWLEGMLEAHPPPLVQGRRLRIRYMTQIKSRPPTFALFVSRPADLPESYLRYLIGGLRDEFGLDGIPVRMVMRKGNNPYA
ncbi:ribosome biogenesis GTPase Der [Alphaproteobacteria bacterium]|nr:ribosome biogenesis GTPase Der [Alphaproteobacteria bacterium]MDC0461919.1 ribosome biogenesis GTPase Der [Alphaproteobacteria bacterium]MDC3311793.1 ribosome biogenesis GTPase Der [Alphaproteobacteria bacterium]